MRDYLAEVKTILGAGGSAYCLVPIGDPKYENAAHTTVTSIGAGGGDGLTFTYVAARTSWAQPTLYKGRARVPWVRFKGSGNEYLTTPDIDFFSLGNGLADTPFSLGMALVLAPASGNQRTFFKSSIASNREYELLIGGPSPRYGQMEIVDQSVDVSAVIYNANGIWMKPGDLHIYGWTYDGSGGATAANGMNHYRNGLQDPSPTRNNNAAYVAMENLAATPVIGGDGVGTGFMGYILGGLCGPYITKQQLTAAQERALSDIYFAALRDQVSGRRQAVRR